MVMVPTTNLLFSPFLKTKFSTLFFLFSLFSESCEKKIGGVITDSHTWKILDKMVLLICWALPYIRDSPRNSFPGWDYLVSSYFLPSLLLLDWRAYADIGSLPPVGLHPGCQGFVPLDVLTC